MKIKVLDEITANKIAAGEVVERPASVVKELLENALDAGSTAIRIDIEEGGAKTIKITDNGGGISTDEVPLAFQRHATSKIIDANDLEHINTLGFRGEALPSIAAVSRVTMNTRTVDSIIGTIIEIQGGKQIKLLETGCPIGTSITVNDIFFNTPARKKHMKSLNIETGHISDIVGRLAMAYPEVSFQLFNNNRNLIQTPGTGNTLDAIAAIHGIETARELFEVNYEDKLIKLQGYIAKPVVSRSNRNHQSLFLNKRYIRSRMISEAVEEGYHTLLNIGRHPLFILNIYINPEFVDVNVHPTKMEVRFSEAEQIRETIVKVTRETLLGDRLIPEIAIPVNKKPAKIEYVQQNLELKKEIIIKEEIDKPYDKGELSEIKQEHENISVVSEPTENKKVTNEVEQLPEMVPIGQIDATYIVAQGQSGMYLIDQHAAHERILYEELMTRDVKVVSQELLIPVTIELTHLETQLLVNNIIIFTDLGFKIEHFGGDTFLIRAVPQILPNKTDKDFFLDLLDFLSKEKGKVSPNEIKEGLLITTACKGAIKANHRLTVKEMDELLYRLQKTNNPYTCPHGRPTIIHISGYELEKKFKRVL